MSLLQNKDPRFENLNRKIGIFVLTVLVATAFVLIVVGIKKNLFTATTDIVFVTNSAQGITEGMPVKLSGFKIGKVKSIELDDVAQVKVTMAIFRKYMQWIRVDSKARLTKEGLIGDSIIEITAGSAKSAPATEHTKLHFDRERGISELMQEVRDELEPIIVELTQIMKYINDPQGDIKQAIANVRHLTEQLNDTLEQTNDLLKNTDKTITSTNKGITKLLDNLTTTTLVATEMLKKVDKDLPAVLEDVKVSLTNIKQITEDLKTATSKSAPQVPKLLEKGADIADDTQEITGAVKRIWPLKNFIKQPSNQPIPVDSYE